MPSDLYWIGPATEPRLAIMARPRAGDWLEDEIAHWQRSGVATVVSLLEPDEVCDLGLECQPGLCAQHGIDFLSFPIRDRGLPDDETAARGFIRALASREGPIAIHCRAGIGRSSLVAAAVMIARGMAAADALAAITEARGLPIPDTDAQRDWVIAFAPH